MNGYGNQPIPKEAAKQLLALDLEDKEILTYEKLDQWYTAWNGKCYVSFYLENPKGANKGNGKVIGEFTCDRIYELAPLNHAPDDVETQACLTREEIVNYIKGTGYGWHIVDLRIYDQPRELTEFRRSCPNDLFCESCAMYSNNNGICNNGALPLRRPPQSWCYVEEMKNV